VREAVVGARARGIEPVLCTGRRFRRAAEVAARVGLEVPLVCNSGALVKDPATGRTLWRADLGEVELRGLLGFFAGRGEPVVSFADGAGEHAGDFVVSAHPTGREHFDDYVRVNLEHASVVPGWEGRAPGEPGHFHLCVVGERPAMLECESALHGELPGRFRSFVQHVPRYRGWMCEVIRADASKWGALGHLAELWGVAADEVCAVGDDLNDVEMLAGAGLGVAMAHAPEAVRAAADLVIEPDDLAGFLGGLA
jgi:hydroxymethylpyrimidine pyrophosphatase-like HAD family hydrolase